MPLTTVHGITAQPPLGFRITNDRYYRYRRYRSKPNTKPSALRDLKRGSLDAIGGLGVLGPQHASTHCNSRSTRTPRLPAVERVVPSTSALTHRLRVHAGGERNRGRKLGARASSTA